LINRNKNTKVNSKLKKITNQIINCSKLLSKKQNQKLKVKHKRINLIIMLLSLN